MSDLEQMAREVASECFEIFLRFPLGGTPGGRPYDAEKDISLNITHALATVQRETRAANAAMCATEAKAAHLTDDRWDRGYRQACINNAAAIEAQGE